MFTSPAEQIKIQEEAQQISDMLSHGSEVEHGIALNGIETDQRNAAAEDRDFQTFHNGRNISRMEDQFLLDHKEYVNTVPNHAAIARWLAERNLTEADLTRQLLEDAYTDLASRNELQLSGKLKLIPSVSPREDLSPEETYKQYQIECDKEAAAEAEDRRAYEKLKATPAIQFVDRHPEFVVSDVNNAAIDSWLNAHGIKGHQITVEILESAFNELSSQHRLQLRAKPAKSEQVFESESSLYDLPMAELERRAGGRETSGRPAVHDDYVPDPNIRYKVGGVSSRF